MRVLPHATRRYEIAANGRHQMDGENQPGYLNDTSKFERIPQTTSQALQDQQSMLVAEEPEQRAGGPNPGEVCVCRHENDAHGRQSLAVVGRSGLGAPLLSEHRADKHTKIATLIVTPTAKGLAVSS